MKHNQDRQADRPLDPQLVPIRFDFTDSKAASVRLAGTFNHWQPEAGNMNSSGVGNWWTDTLLAPGSYEYCFVVDGRWILDPLARGSVPNPYGGRNSVLAVASSPEAAHRADAESLPMQEGRL